MQYIHRYSQKSREKSMYILIGLVIAVLIRLLHLFYIYIISISKEGKQEIYQPNPYLISSEGSSKTISLTKSTKNVDSWIMYCSNSGHIFYLLA